MAKEVNDQSITEISKEQETFILEDRDLNPQFMLKLWYHKQVPAGQLWWVYRDGIHVGTWEPGPHDLWNALWHTWRALIMEMRIIPREYSIAGRIRGPEQAQETRSAAGVDLSCKVTANLSLSCKLSKIERFIQYKNPLSEFDALLSGLVIEIMQKLDYDQVGLWSIKLRDGLLANLQGGPRDTEDRVGIRVEVVHVRGFKPDSVVDNNRMEMYKLVERAKRELITAQSNKERNEVTARDFLEQGNLLNIAPSLLALQNSPIGKELLAHDARLREMMLTVGLNPSVSVRPIRDPQAQISETLTSYVNNPPQLNPPPSYGPMPFDRPVPGYSSQLPYTSSSYGSMGTGPIGSNTGPISFPSPSTPPMPFPSPSMPTPMPGWNEQSGPLPFPTSAQPAAETSPVDTSRQDQEVGALQASGFRCAGRGQFSPTYDINGLPIPNSMEWGLEVYITRINGYIMVALQCPPNYPSLAPRVQVRLPGSSDWRAIPLKTIREWNPQKMLVDVVREIDDTTP